MLFAIHDARPSRRLAVFSYDISCPKRARGARKVLDSLHHDKQYSVYEAMLNYGEVRGALTELSACCDLAEDLLAVWWPLDGLRLVSRGNRLHVEACNGEQRGELARLPANTGNFIVCYDISDPEALTTVAGRIAPETMKLQRSVYWFRAGAKSLTALLTRCAPHLADTDRLWAYPLRGSHALWRVGQAPCSVLPISNHRWSES